METNRMPTTTLVIIVLILCILISCKKTETKDIDIPTVKTTIVTQRTMSSFTCGGQIVSSGGADIIKCGICWSTQPDPNITDNRTEQNPAASAFTSTASGLIPSTGYYIRAYAINEKGIGYGDQIECRTYTGSMTDIDGNVYNTISIDSQEWMAENLKVTHYRNGDLINLVTDGTQWSNLIDGAYCIYGNNIVNTAIYGNLYNWYAIEDVRNLAPTGWHIPTDNEWTIMESFLGGPGISGNKLKEEGATLWWTGNCSTNESSFTALPGGRRYYFGSFTDMGRDAYWWTGTQASISDAKVFHLCYSTSGTCRCTHNLNNGFSVRCVKD